MILGYGSFVSTPLFFMEGELVAPRYSCSKIRYLFYFLISYTYSIFAWILNKNIEILAEIPYYIYDEKVSI